jgi:hypothetical protein
MIQDLARHTYWFVGQNLCLLPLFQESEEINDDIVPEKGAAIPLRVKYP